MNTTTNSTKMQPETVKQKKLSRAEMRRQQKAADKAEKAEAKKKMPINPRRRSVMGHY